MEFNKIPKNGTNSLKWNKKGFLGFQKYKKNPKNGI